MAKKPLPSPELLRQLLRYEPETGRLFWRTRSPLLFTANRQTALHQANKWNHSWAEKQAFKCIDKYGYANGSIAASHYKAHRVIWAICYGEWPQGEIDHIDGDPLNNRINNLRVVTRRENLQNVARSRVNSSGITGVTRIARSGKWHAFIHENRRKISLGEYQTKDEAVSARMIAAEQYGYHENHGRENKRALIGETK